MFVRRHGPQTLRASADAQRLGRGLPPFALYSVALADRAVASMDDCFPAASALDQILCVLDGLALSGVLRVGGVSSWLNDLPCSSGAWNYVRLMPVAHRRSIPIPKRTQGHLKGTEESPANAWWRSEAAPPRFDGRDSIPGASDLRRRGDGAELAPTRSGIPPDLRSFQQLRAGKIARVPAGFAFRRFRCA
jgi:hypothetical protein